MFVMCFGDVGCARAGRTATGKTNSFSQPARQLVCHIFHLARVRASEQRQNYGSLRCIIEFANELGTIVSVRSLVRLDPRARV